MILGSVCGLTLSTMILPARHRGLVVGRGANAVAAAQFLQPVGQRLAGGDRLRLDQLLGQDAPDHRLGHDAGADEGQCGVF